MHQPYRHGGRAGGLQKDLEIQMGELFKARGHLRSRNRREPDDGKREERKEEIREMTRRIRKLRGELTLCDGIAQAFRHPERDTGDPA